MKSFKYILIIAGLLLTTSVSALSLSDFFSWAKPNNQEQSITLGAAPTQTFLPSVLPILDDTYYLGSSSPSLRWKGLWLSSNTSGSTRCLQILSTGSVEPATAACGSGGGGSGGTWSTTTSQVAGTFINYPNNDTDVVAIGSSASTTAEFWFDPSIPQFNIRNWPMGTTTATVCKTVGECKYNTISSAISAGWKDIYVKDGTYSEQITAGNTKLKLRAQSLGTIIQCNGATQSPCITSSAKDEFVLDGFTISETNANSVGVALDVSNTALVRIRNNRFNNFATSTVISDTANNSFYGEISSNTFFSPKTCIEWSGTQANQWTMTGNRCRPLAVDGGYGAFLSGVRGLTFTGMDFEGTSTGKTNIGVYVDGTSREITLVNPWIEALGTGLQIDSGANRVTVVGGSITSNGTDITDNGTQTVFLNTSDTGVLVNKLGRATTTGLAVGNLVSCDSIDSTSNGDLICGTDASGSGGSGNVATSTTETAGNLAYWTSTGATPATLGKVATTTLTIGSPLTTSGTPGFLVGGTNLTIDIDDIKAADLDLTDITLADFTNDTNFLANTRQLTVAGTANQISSSAGAQDLSADRTWTLSLPNHVIFPSSFQVTRATTTHATTTNLDITSLLTFNGVTSSTWAGFCVTITGSAGLCDGDDASGAGGGASNSKWSTSTADSLAIYNNAALRVGIGTTTPKWALQVASSTGAQLTLTDPSASNNHWSFRNDDGVLFLATSSPTTFSTSTASVLTIDSVGDATFSNHIFVTDGGTGAAAYSWANDPNTGIYRAGTDSLGFTAAGNGLAWNGTDFRPNTDAVRNLGTTALRWLGFNAVRSTTTAATTTDMHVSNKGLTIGDTAQYVTATSSGIISYVASTTVSSLNNTAFANGTSTYLLRFPEARKLTSVACSVPSGTVNFEIGTGSASTTIACSSTWARTYPSSNNTFTADQAIFYSLKTVSGTPGSINEISLTWFKTAP